MLLPALTCSCLALPGAEWAGPAGWLQPIRSGLPCLGRGQDPSGGASGGRRWPAAEGEQSAVCPTAGGAAGHRCPAGSSCGGAGTKSLGHGRRGGDAAGSVWGADDHCGRYLASGLQRWGRWAIVGRAGASGHGFGAASGGGEDGGAHRRRHRGWGERSQQQLLTIILTMMMMTTMMMMMTVE